MHTRLWTFSTGEVTSWRGTLLPKKKRKSEDQSRAVRCIVIGRFDPGRCVAVRNKFRLFVMVAAFAASQTLSMAQSDTTPPTLVALSLDRKSTRLSSSH